MSGWIPIELYESDIANFTAADMRQFSRGALENLYAQLTATALPQGRFTGHAWSHSLPGVWLLAWAWQGKVFDPLQSNDLLAISVRNRILGHEFMKGAAFLYDGEVVIWYSQFRTWRGGGLHLSDYLKPVTPALWLGQMRLWGGHVVWFTLEAE